jgi:2-succinyl-5-enolpyruvyl-6-hydroxy-3-cyclohexene-1-carboxylate synthase
MSDLNPRWADTLVSGWVEAGVQHAVICPGSRSTPLALACARAGGLRCWSVLDERSAGFFALGLAQATGRPAAVIVTSGTAGAHLYPAVIEASLTRVPLLVVTADRPWELQGWGAPQTIAQAGLFGGFARWAVELAAPEENEAAFRHLRATAVRAVAAARGRPAGPVHLNVPFREPLAALPSGVPPASGGLGWFESVAAPHPAGLERAAALLGAHARGVILVGPHRPGDGLDAALASLSRATGYPVLAEVASNARFGTGAGRAISHYDALWRTPAFADAHVPDLILRFGGGLTARGTLAFVDRAREVIVFPDDGAIVDPSHAASVLLQGDPVAAATALAGRIQRGDGPWAAAWFAADQAVGRALAELREPELTEPAVARAVSAGVPSGANLVLASSMPIRDMDAFASARPLDRHVYSNRGANGIEGTLSTGLGLAAGSGRPTWVLVGDLAFLHDMGALLTALRTGIPLGVIVVNNDGGGIFSFLPVASASPHFEPLFGTPHGLEFSALAGQFHAAYERVDTEQGLAGALQRPLDQVRIIEARVPGRSENVAVHQRWFSRLREAVEGRR